MSDRLQFFREQMAAFEGTSDPQKAIEQGYFIKQPRNSLANTIANRIALRPSSSHLLIGGIGSGKTTQLMMARDRINEIGDTHAVYVDASLYTDISEIKPGALIAIVGLVLHKLTEDISQDNLYKLKHFIETEAYGYYLDELEEGVYIPDNTYQPGILNKYLSLKQERFNKAEWKKTIKSLYEIIENRLGKSIIIIDGLDRLSDIQTFYNLINHDIEIIMESGVGIILVGSLTLAYSDNRVNIENIFNYYYHQPCFDVNRDEESFDFFRKILQVRFKHKDFIKDSAIRNLILYSGGVLRDLINLTQAAIEEAYILDSENVLALHVDAGIDSFGRLRILGTNNDELKILEELVFIKDNFIPRTQEDIQLLASQRILEYQYPQKRYAIHPTIKLLLQKASV